MAMTRRGFLGVLSASMVGAVVLDPKHLLWVPKPPELVQFAPDAFSRVMAPLNAQQVMDTQAELNALALRCAKRLADRLDRHEGIVLREVFYKLAGHVQPGYLEIEGEGTHDFETAGGRIMKHGVIGDRRDYYGVEPKSSDDIWIDHVTAEVAYAAANIDVFAPIGTDLREGVQFADNMRIGVATDPASGVSVRVLRWEHDTGRAGKGVLRHGLEVAGGKWHRKRDTRRPRFSRADWV